MIHGPRSRTTECRINFAGAAMREIPWLTRVRLVLSGWYSRPRKIDRIQLPSSMEPFPEAMRIIRRYGGLSYKKSSEILKLEPAVADEVATDMRRYEQLV